MASIKFFIEGEAIGKQRPKFRRRGNFVTTYTPKETREWEEEIKRQAEQFKPDELMEGPVSMNLTFFLHKPTSARKKDYLVHKKPDWDNLGKCVSDALEGLFYKNDSQIFRCKVLKFYAGNGKEGIEVEVSSASNSFQDILL
tara:strand:- start:929 stop:1354 length:426 start_codon:yes stop_codon:yes gene_type:complete